LSHKTGDCINFLTEEAEIPSGYIIINIKEHCRGSFHSNEKNPNATRSLANNYGRISIFKSKKAKFKGNFERGKKRDFVRPSLIHLRLAESPGETKKDTTNNRSKTRKISRYIGLTNFKNLTKIL